MGLSLTQKYNKVITDIALERKGIKGVNSPSDLTDENWEVLNANAKSVGMGEDFAEACVSGYFGQTGTEYLEAEFGEDY